MQCHRFQYIMLRPQECLKNQFLASTFSETMGLIICSYVKKNVISLAHKRARIKSRIKWVRKWISQNRIELGMEFKIRIAILTLNDFNLNFLVHPDGMDFLNCQTSLDQHRIQKSTLNFTT